MHWRWPMLRSGATKVQRAMADSDVSRSTRAAATAPMTPPATPPMHLASGDEITTTGRFAPSLSGGARALMVQALATTVDLGHQPAMLADPATIRVGHVQRQPVLSGPAIVPAGTAGTTGADAAGAAQGRGRPTPIQLSAIDPAPTRRAEPRVMDVHTQTSSPTPTDIDRTLDAIDDPNPPRPAGRVLDPLPGPIQLTAADAPVPQTPAPQTTVQQIAAPRSAVPESAVAESAVADRSRSAVPSPGPAVAPTPTPTSASAPASGVVMRAVAPNTPSETARSSTVPASASPADDPAAPSRAEVPVPARSAAVPVITITRAVQRSQTVPVSRHFPMSPREPAPQTSAVAHTVPTDVQVGRSADPPVETMPVPTDAVVVARLGVDVMARPADPTADGHHGGPVDPAASSVAGSAPVTGAGVGELPLQRTEHVDRTPHVRRSPYGAAPAVSPPAPVVATSSESVTTPGPVPSGAMSGSGSSVQRQADASTPDGGSVETRTRNPQATASDVAPTDSSTSGPGAGDIDTQRTGDTGIDPPNPPVAQTFTHPAVVVPEHGLVSPPTPQTSRITRGASGSHDVSAGDAGTTVSRTVADGPGSSGGEFVGSVRGGDGSLRTEVGRSPELPLVVPAAGAPRRVQRSAVGRPIATAQRETSETQVSSQPVSFAAMFGIGSGTRPTDASVADSVDRARPASSGGVAPVQRTVRPATPIHPATPDPARRDAMPVAPGPMTAQRFGLPVQLPDVDTLRDRLGEKLADTAGDQARSRLGEAGQHLRDSVIPDGTVREIADRLPGVTQAADGLTRTVADRVGNIADRVGNVAHQGASAVAGAAAAGGSSTDDLEDLARRLYEPLSARLRTELWLDRERAGFLTDQ